MQTKALKFLILFFLTISLFHQQTFAQTVEIDEGFDPFSDYSESEQNAEEEADINFFKNGRFLTLGLLLGLRTYTDGMSQAYAPSLSWGMQFSYFFDMQLATSLSYTIADSNVEFRSYNDDSFTSVSQVYTGTVNIQIFNLNAKYYFNTENVTRGLADLNPYIMAGVGLFTRTYNLSNTLPPQPDKPFGLSLSGGIEIPIKKRNSYIGLQATYHFVQFPDENNDRIKEVKAGSSSEVLSPVRPRINGDLFEIFASYGINF